MNNLLVVAAGGAVGSVLRYLANVAVVYIWPAQLYIATFFVNIVGCFLLGCAFAWFVVRPEASELIRLLLMVGLLGGFTTFSTFSLEALRLFADGQSIQALLYMGASLTGGLLATWLGMTLIKLSL